MLPALLAAGVLVHEAVYWASKGRTHFVDDFAPTFGVHLPRALRLATHLFFVAAAITFAIHPENFCVWACLSGSATLMVVSFPLRVPNHLVLLLFVLAAIGITWGSWISDRSQTLAAIRLLFAGTLFAAGFHKLNRTFFDRRLSCGPGLVVHYLLQRGIRMSVVPAWFSSMAIGVVIVFELGLPIVLLLSGWTSLGVLASTVLVVAFGFLGHAHFSLLMLACVTAFVPQAASMQPQLSPPVLCVACVMAALFSNAKPYRYRLCIYANAVILSAAGLGVGLAAIGSRSAADISIRPVGVGIIALLVVFFINAASPYLGLKWNGSFAMFSNLRPDLWDHFIIRRRLRIIEPRYVRAPLLFPRSLRATSGPLLASYFPHPESETYSVTYVAEVLAIVRQRCRSSADSIFFTCRVIGTGRTEVLRDAGADLRIWERLSIYPGILPSLDEPLIG